MHHPAFLSLPRDPASAVSAALRRLRAVAVRHPLAAYFALAYALSWAQWIPLALRGARVAPGAPVTHFPGLLGPALAAFLVTALTGGGQGVRSLARSCVRLPRDAAFWLLSLSPLAFLALAIGIELLLGHPTPPLASFRVYSGLPETSIAVVVALAILVNGLGEEAGWRGFALPRLQARFGPLGGTLILALLWAGWHAPLFLTNEGYRQMSAATLLGGFLFGLTCGALVLSFVTARTGGSVAAAAIWHGLYNMTSATGAAAGMLAAITTACVMTWAAALVVLELRARKRGASVLRVETQAGPIPVETVVSARW